MVSTDAQLYTMEGIAAGVIMILTAYLVLGSTSVYTPGDTHLTDMQLEQVGSDILKIMDTPETPGTPSELEQYVYENKGAEFRYRFWNEFLMNLDIAAQQTTGRGSSTFAFATVYYRSADGTVKNYRIFDPYIPYSGGQPGVIVTRFVKVNGRGKIGSDGTADGCRCWVDANCPSPPSTPPYTICMPTDVRDEPQVMLVEVFLWKA
jgi:hypothetical protein